MQKSPDARFPSADAMRRALGEIDLRPTIPRGIIPSAARGEIEIEPPSSGIVTPPPSGTAGELGIAPATEARSSRWGMVTAVVLAALATVAVLIWLDARPERTEVRAKASVRPVLEQPERRTSSREVPRAERKGPAVVKTVPVPSVPITRPIVIKTDPPGAQVEFKGTVLGKTPSLPIAFQTVLIA